MRNPVLSRIAGSSMRGVSPANSGMAMPEIRVCFDRAHFLKAIPTCRDFVRRKLPIIWHRISKNLIKFNPANGGIGIPIYLN
jgi:hypothetical protein